MAWPRGNRGGNRLQAVRVPPIEHCDHDASRADHLGDIGQRRRLVAGETRLLLLDLPPQLAHVGLLPLDSGRKFGR